MAPDATPDQQEESTAPTLEPLNSPPPPQQQQQAALLISSENANNSERSAVVLALFGPSVGPCVGDFATNYGRVNGRLYAATKAILFYSNLFGFERRLLLRFSDVEHIDAYRLTSIKISMVDCEDHVFRKFPNRDAVLEILKELLPKRFGETATATRSLLVSAMTADTTPEGSQHNMNTNMTMTMTLEDGESQEEGPLRPHLSSELTPEPSEASPSTTSKSLRPRSQSVPLLQSPSEHFREDPPPPPPRRTNSTISSSSAQLAPPPQPTNDSVKRSVQRTTTTDETAMIIPDNFDMQTAWDHAKRPYDEIALEVSKRRSDRRFVVAQVSLSHNCFHGWMVN
jgi:hypothetical protein